MKRTKIIPALDSFPTGFHSLMQDAAIFDSSCSEEARVYYIDKECGFYLKTAPAGALEREAALTRYFHKKGLASEVLAYCQEDRDWLLTCRAPGEDCTHRMYLEDPQRLAELLGIQLRKLHELDFSGCPVIDHTKRYLDTVFCNYEAGHFDNTGRYHPCRDPKEAIRIVNEYSSLLKCDTLLHGDYCLPNIMLDNWCFSGFIDLGNGGVGDRHIDLYWGTWTLRFNLKTDAWCSRFLDAYGRDRIDLDVLKAIGAFEAFG